MSYSVSHTTHILQISMCYSCLFTFLFTCASLSKQISIHEWLIENIQISRLTKLICLSCIKITDLEKVSENSYVSLELKRFVIKILLYEFRCTSKIRLCIEVLPDFLRICYFSIRQTHQFGKVKDLKNIW